MEALQPDSVQMLAPSLGKFGPLGVKDFEVFDLPFIFKDDAAFRAITEGPVGADLFKKLVWCCTLCGTYLPVRN